MLGISRFASSAGLSKVSFGEALLDWGFLRVGLRRNGSIEELSDHLRRDVGLSHGLEAPADLRDRRW